VASKVSEEPVIFAYGDSDLYRQDGDSRFLRKFAYNSQSFTVFSTVRAEAAVSSLSMRDYRRRRGVISSLLWGINATLFSR